MTPKVRDESALRGDRAERGRIPNLRWWIAVMLALATLLSYLDRQSLPVLVSELQKHIPISDVEYSQMQSLFLLAYAVMYAGGGRLLDRLGTRAGYVVMIVWWSVANMLHGFAGSVFTLGLFRFLLGLGEGGAFPGAAKAVSEWFPVRERAMAFGIFNTGSSAGAVIAPPLIALIVSVSTWQAVFFLSGLGGLVWAFGWWKLYRAPQGHPRITLAEETYLAGAIEAVPVEQSAPGAYLQLFRYRQVWGLVAAKFLSDSAWFFFIFWLPKYLGDVRHLDIKAIGYYAWIPYALAGAGSLTGGWMSSFLIRRGFSLDASRKIALAVSAALMPAALGIMAAPLSLAIVFFSAVMFGHQFWSTIIQTLAADLFPSRVVGSVAGILGCAGSFGAMLFNLLVGQILDYSHSYESVFLIAGLLHPASLVLILALVRRIERVEIQTSSLTV